MKINQHQQSIGNLSYPKSLRGTGLTGLYNPNTSTPLQTQSRYPVVAIFALLAGTFGQIGQNAIINQGTSNWSISVSKESKAENENNSAEHLKYIIDITKISITEMARVFGVSRQAVYDWLNGATVSDKNNTAISNFENAMQIFLKAGLKPTVRDFRRKINGISVLDGLDSHEDSSNLGHALASTMLREQSQRIKLAERFKNREKPQLQNEDFGAPHLADEA